MIVAFDPPEHTRIRRLLSAGFTPRMVARLEADIERRSEKILDDVMARATTSSTSSPRSRTSCRCT